MQVLLRRGSVIAATTRSRFARWELIAATAVAVTVASVAVVAARPADAVQISGATTLSDKVSVNWDGDRASWRTTDLHLIAWNDFHGNLEPANMTVYNKFAGGAAYLAKMVKDKQRKYGARQATVLAGDDIGASPLANGLFHEEPAIIADNFMKVDFSSVGNHEFDKGRVELLRMQNGGCNPAGCNGAPYALPPRHPGQKPRTTDTYPGADFQYLAANVIDEKTGKTLFPAYGIKRFRSSIGLPISVGFIGEVLKATPTIVTPSGVAGLTFTDEADAANKAARELAKRGVKIPVLVIHQGGAQTGPVITPGGCAGNLAGSDIEAIAKRLDPSIKIIVSGHTHNEYRCTITTNGVTRLITSAASYGRILSDLTLKVNNFTGQLVSADATNTIVENALNTPGAGVVRQDDPSKADPQMAAIVKQYVDASAPLANRVIGKIQGDLNRTLSPLGESTMGDVIADAQLAATAAADKGAAKVAFMNPGGVRADLQAGNVTYGQAFTVQPFGNSLVTKTMTGAMIRRLLEQQFVGCGGQITQRVLQPSASITFQAKPAAANCADKIGEIKVNGATLQPTDSLRVTMNSFLATGGDGFTVFNEGTEALGGAQDIDALADYLTAAGATGVPVPTLTRITAF